MFLKIKIFYLNTFNNLKKMYLMCFRLVFDKHIISFTGIFSLIDIAISTSKLKYNKFVFIFFVLFKIKVVKSSNDTLYRKLQLILN